MVPDKIKNSSSRAKLIASIASAVVAAAIGAGGTIEASKSPTSLNDSQAAQVRQIVKTESPVNQASANRLYQRLIRIEGKENTLQIQAAENQSLLRLVLKAVTVKAK